MSGCCKHNKCILCDDHSKCYKCGWDPAVFEERKRRTREKFILEKLEQQPDQPKNRKAKKWRFVSL